jgi:hypothetical protein
MRRARAAGRFEAVAEVVDFGRHVPPQSTVGDRFNSTGSYVHIVDRNSIVSIRSAPVPLLAEAGSTARLKVHVFGGDCIGWTLAG